MQTAQKIQRVAVIGLGTMGHGIAQTCAAAGCTVLAYDNAAEHRASLPDRVAANVARMTAAGLLSAAAARRAGSGITVVDQEAEAVSDAQFVFEVIREDLEPKQQLMSRLEELVGDDCVLASNSSTFPCTQIAANLRTPQRAVNTHWFNPPHIVPLVEVIAGQQTAPGTVDLAVAFMRRLGKTPVRVNQEVPGFIVNRVQAAMIREVIDLWQRGVASAEDIDTAIRSSMGFRLAACGPLQIADFGGLHIWQRVYEELVPKIQSGTATPQVLLDLVAAGHLGPKTGKGFYTYTEDQVAQRQAERDTRFLQLAKLLYGDTAD